MREDIHSLIEVHVSTLIFHASGNKILLLKRSLERKLYRGLWESTGGQVFRGESFLEAAYRISLTEIGIRPHISAIIGTYVIPANDDLLHRTLIPGIRFLGIIETEDTNQIILTNQHTICEFVEKKDIENFELIPNLDEDIEVGFSTFTSFRKESLFR